MKICHQRARTGRRIRWLAASPGSKIPGEGSPSARAAQTALMGLVATVLSSCATPQAPLPDAIRLAPPGNLQLVEARQDIEQHLGASVRWGGTVVTVRRDDAGNAEVEILERKLGESGRPRPAGPSDGRFLVRATTEVDPVLYREGSDVTVAGVLERSVEGRIGDQPAVFPVVRVEQFVRWQAAWRRYDPYYYYDPWYYGPWVGYGRHYGHLHRPYFGHYYHPYRW